MEILSLDLNKKGFTLIAAKLVSLSEETAKTHYGEHKERPFFGELVEFITSGPVFAMVWEGESVVKTARQLIGLQIHWKLRQALFVVILRYKWV